MARAVGAVAVIYSLPGVPQLKLSGEVVADGRRVHDVEAVRTGPSRVGLSSSTGGSGGVGWVWDVG